MCPFSKIAKRSKLPHPLVNFSDALALIYEVQLFTLCAWVLALAHFLNSNSLKL